ncbi:MAG: Uma2 family endonuclease [Microscillaceae bacterium]|nr:Uma2 family endonuclease [Microscillaceae bacterium]
MEKAISTLTQERFYATVKEYLYWEDRAEEKHEYHNGEVIAMAGGEINHNRVCRNLVSGLHTRLKGKSCETFNSENKVWIAERNRFYYPDAFVICGEIQFYEKRQDIVENPILIFEVLSESTELRDRGEKFRHYMSLPSFREYVLINPEVVLVEIFFKKSPGEWQYFIYHSLTETVHLQSIDVHLSVADIYEQVDLTLAPETPAETSRTNE